MAEHELQTAFADNFKRLRKSKNLLQKDMVNVLGVSSSVVSDWEKGTKMPRGGTLQKIADFFQVPQIELLIKAGSPYMALGEMLSCPIVGNIISKNGVAELGDTLGYEVIPKVWLDNDEYFYFYAKDNSMLYARIVAGDKLLICRQHKVDNGRIALMFVNNEVVLRRVYKNTDMLLLQPENPTHTPIYCSEKDVQIIGELTMVRLTF